MDVEKSRCETIQCTGSRETVSNSIGSALEFFLIFVIYFFYHHTTLGGVQTVRICTFKYIVGISVCDALLSTIKISNYFIFVSRNFGDDDTER